MLPGSQAQAQAPAQKPDARGRMRRIWKESRPVECGDDVDLYLRMRGLAFTEFPADLRYVPVLRYFEGGQASGAYPAMAALVRDAEGAPKSMHVTYLQAGKKAPVANPKKVLAAIGQGAAIRLFAATDVLCVAEGIETALAVHKRAARAAWACISEAGLRAFTPPAGVSRVIIAADNDETYVGQAAAYALARRLVDMGVRADVRVPNVVGTDWADALKKGEASE